MKRIWIWVLCTALAVIPAWGGVALASGTLYVGPSRITPSAALNPGESYLLPTHRVTNQTAHDIEVTVSVSEHTDDTRSLPPAGWFGIDPVTFAVVRGEVGETQIEVNLPEDAGPGGYRVWFRFQSMPVGVSGTVIAHAVQVSLVFDVADASQASADHALTVQTEGEGTVQPYVGSRMHRAGTMVTLTAEPADGWEFALWRGEVTDELSSSTAVRVDSDLSVTAVFSEIEPEIVGLRISPFEVELEADEVLQLRAAVLYSDGSERSGALRWSSSDQGVATVEMDGTLRAISGGEAEVAAEVEGHRSVMRVRVIESPTGDEPEEMQPVDAENVPPISPDASDGRWPLVAAALIVSGGGAWVVHRRYSVRRRR